MKIAVLFAADLNNRKGLFNAIVNRVKSLMAISDCTIDVFCFQARPSGFYKLIRKQDNRNYNKVMEVDGLSFQVMWYKQYLTEDFLTNRLHLPSLFFRKWAKKNISVFSSYDIISAHSSKSGEVARLIKKEYGIPYFVTWHGTDIHTTPFLSSSLKNSVTDIIQNATCNFFVSKALLKVAKSFISNFNAEVLYNGVGEIFMKYNEEKRHDLRQKFGVVNKKVVAFVGNLIPIKNVTLLPLIFNEVSKKTSQPIVYWIIGDGFLKETVSENLKKIGLDYVLWGNVPSSEMPLFMNCIDVLVLPSKNEGLPLVTLEAIACGANAVGSKVGGIPEAIGDENTFELDDAFVSRISKRIVFMLTNKVKQYVGQDFNWKQTALKEISVYKKLFIEKKEKNENT